MTKKITILGGGPGGYVAAIKASQNGGEVTLIEKSSLGGTCLNWGCIPTKAYVEKAENISTDSLKSIKEYKDQVVEQLVKGVETLVNKNKIKLIRGTGKVISPRKVEVTTQEEQIFIENDYLILATGSKASKLPIPGLDLPQVIDNQGILELEEKPENLVIIGGGVIGIEFAQIFARLGSKVTIVEFLPRILAGFDDELVRRLQPVLRKEGIEILTGSKVTQVNALEKGLEVHIEGKKNQVLPADQVLVAAGRQPNFEGIAVEELGLELEGRFIKVNEKMLTNLPQVYAIGDIVPSPMLAHVASYEGEVAVKDIFTGQGEANYTAVPSSLYTHPELASVGITEAQAKEQGLKYKVGKFPFSANGRALTKGEAYGMVKILADEETGKVLGAHILGPQASELIQTLTLAIRWGLTVEQITETIHGHPTLSEAIMESANSVFGKAIHFL